MSTTKIDIFNALKETTNITHDPMLLEASASISIKIIEVVATHGHSPSAYNIAVCKTVGYEREKIPKRSAQLSASTQAVIPRLIRN
jgi:hypothetical protein